MCMIDDGESGVMLDDRTVKAARVEHYCSECRRTIHVGESYRTMSGVYDGHFYVEKHCAHCAVAAEWLIVACRGYLFSAVLEDLREHWEWEALRTPVLGLLIEGMAAKWHDGTDPVPDVEVVRASARRAA